ncbi:MAG: methyltransferase domain-containing protein [Gammaproteobacteria bacterium]
MHSESRANRGRQTREARKLRVALGGFSGALAVQVGGEEANWVASARYARIVRVGLEPAGVAVRGHAEALPLDQTSSDLVLLIHVLEGSSDPAAVIGEAARVLRGEGRLVIVARHLPVSPLEWPAALAEHKRLASCRRLRRLIEDAGLEWRGGAAFARSGGRTRRRAGCLGLSYASHAAVGVKRVAGGCVIKPAWKDRLRSRSGALQEHGQTG